MNTDSFDDLDKLIKMSASGLSSLKTTLKSMGLDVEIEETNRTSASVLDKIEDKLYNDIGGISIKAITQCIDKNSFQRLLSDLPDEIQNALINKYYE